MNHKVPLELCYTSIKQEVGIGKFSKTKLCLCVIVLIDTTGSLKYHSSIKQSFTVVITFSMLANSD